MDTKSIWTSKTFWVNVISGMVMFLQGQEVITLIPPKYVPYEAAAVFGLNIILRYITTQPVTLSSPNRLSIVLLAITLGTTTLTGCAGNFHHLASQANDKLATATEQVQLGFEAAHTRDCHPETPGLQPCVSDVDYRAAQTKFSQVADGGIAISNALDAGDNTSVRMQANAVVNLLSDLLKNDVLKLPAGEKLVAVSALTAARTVLAALGPAPTATK